MVCLYCKSETAVVNSRPQKKANNLWRRRQCLACRAIFTSIESFDLSCILSVTSAPEIQEPFSRDKLFASMLVACEHMPTALVTASALTDTVIAKLKKNLTNGIISAEQIATLTAQTLKHFDTAAFIRYMSLRTSLKNTTALKKLLKD